MAVDVDRKRRRAAFDWDNGRSLYPAIDDGSDKWAAVLAQQPDVMYSMIADIVKVAKATEGPRRTGRRPAITGLSIEELWSTLYPPRYSTDPFPQALSALVTTSQRTFAAKVPCDQGTLSRWMTGKITPDLAAIEAVARAGRVPPTYFAEYRAWKLGKIVAETLLAQPSMSIAVVKRLAKDRAKS